MIVCKRKKLTERERERKRESTADCDKKVIVIEKCRFVDIP
jgi:hypothetical protein